jgi:hypothetical protein
MSMSLPHFAAILFLLWSFWKQRQRARAEQAKARGAAILQRIIRRVDYEYSPWSHGCDIWAAEYQEFEPALEFLHAHYYQNFGRKK